MLVQAGVLALFLPGTPNASQVALVLAAVALFTARAPTAALRRGQRGRAANGVWAISLVLGAGVAAAFVVPKLSLPLVVASGVVGALLAVFNIRRQERSTPAELSAMAGFALLVPLGAALHGTRFMSFALLGGVVFAFFATSIPHVRAMVRIRKGPRSPEARRAILVSTSVTGAFVGATAAATAGTLVAPLVFAASTCAAARPIVALVSRARPQPFAIRTVGLIELAVSTAFTVLILLSAPGDA